MDNIKSKSHLRFGSYYEIFKNELLFSMYSVFSSTFQWVKIGALKNLCDFSQSLLWCITLEKLNKTVSFIEP